MQHHIRKASSAGKSMATMKEVAARAGVSTATVSRVLAGQKGAGPRVRSRVEQAARDLDFQPNRLAAGLRARQRKVIGLIIPDLQNPFFTGVVSGLENVLCSADYTLLLCHSDGLAKREQAHFGVLRGEGVAGLVLIPGNEPEAQYDALRTWKVPVVSVDRSPRGLETDLVCVTNRDGARTAVEHLLRLGHGDIALINGPRNLDVSLERLAGFQDALQVAGLAIRKSFIVHGDFRQSGGYAAMNGLLKLTPPPRAVLIANNLMTLGALQAIHAAGFRIPADVAVMGFDDMPWATTLLPPLTAVAQPAEELGRTAARLLLDRIQDPGRMIRQVILPTQLIIRASCGAVTTRPLGDKASIPAHAF